MASSSSFAAAQAENKKGIWKDTIATVVGIWPELQPSMEYVQNQLAQVLEPDALPAKGAAVRTPGEAQADAIPKLREDVKRTEAGGYTQLPKVEPLVEGHIHPSVGDRLKPSEQIDPLVSYWVSKLNARPAIITPKATAVLRKMVHRSNDTMSPAEACYGTALAWHIVCALIGWVPDDGAKSALNDVQRFLEVLDLSLAPNPGISKRVKDLVFCVTPENAMVRIASVFNDSMISRYAVATRTRSMASFGNQSLLLRIDQTQRVMQMLTVASVGYNMELGLGGVGGGAEGADYKNAADHGMAAYHVACAFFALQHTAVDRRTLAHLLDLYERHLRLFWKATSNQQYNGLIIEIAKGNEPMYGTQTFLWYKHRYLGAMMILHDPYYSRQVPRLPDSDNGDKAVKQLIEDTGESLAKWIPWSAQHIARAYLYMTAMRHSKGGYAHMRYYNTIVGPSLSI